MSTPARIADDERIEPLGLPLFITNCLRGNGVSLVTHLCACRASDLLKFPGIGPRSVRHIRKALASRDRHLRAERRARS